MSAVPSLAWKDSSLFPEPCALPHPASAALLPRFTFHCLRGALTASQAQLFQDLLPSDLPLEDQHS